MKEFDQLIDHYWPYVFPSVLGINYRLEYLFFFNFEQYIALQLQWSVIKALFKGKVDK